MHDVDATHTPPRTLGDQHLKRRVDHMVFLMMLRRMNVAATAHGFRSSFRDWAAETTSYPRELAEMALAHTVENKVEAAHRRGDLLGKRGELMKQWAMFIANADARNAG